MEYRETMHATPTGVRDDEISREPVMSHTPAAATLTAERRRS
jgi:hypothetical protein